MESGQEIRTERLLLRPWQRSDEAALIRNINHREVTRNTGRIPHPYTQADADAFLVHAEAAARDWVLAIVAGGEAIGGIGLHPREGIEQYTAELGYWLGPTHWGRGFATEAARAVVERAFERTDLARIEARVFAWNPASCRVLEKAGFRQEALKRRAAFKGGELVDEFLYARLRGE